MAKKAKRMAKKAKAMAKRVTRKKAKGMAKGAKPRRLSVRGVYLYFKALEDANLLEAFLQECDQKGHKLAVEAQLY